MTGFVPITTERLVIRPMRAADAATLAAYRDDPETARFQGWSMPFTVDDAVRFVERQERLVWPALDDWNQLAIEREGEMIGDVGVGWSADGRQVTIGYTLAPAERGTGLATEAVGAVVDRLLADGVHRITATLDPANLASAAVVERLGFRYEGRSVAATYDNGEWLDDERYALLASDRAEWLARNQDPPKDVDLVEITDDTSRDVGRLATHRSQRQFVATVYESYGDALTPDVDDEGQPLVPWFRAIRADGELAGFMMTAEATPTNPDPYLWRLLVDRRHQRRGIGKRALAVLTARLAGEGHRRLLTSWVPGPGSPEDFYRGLGFVPTGKIEDGEIEASLHLIDGYSETDGGTER